MMYLFILAIAAGLFLIGGIPKEKFFCTVIILIAIFFIKGLIG